MKLVLDTDIFIDFLRGYAPSKEWFKTIKWEKVLFSAVTEAELLSGEDCNERNSRERTLDLLNFGTKMLVTNEIAKKAGELRRNYKITLLDSFIAATAVLLSAILITRNVKHFKGIKRLKIRNPY